MSATPRTPGQSPGQCSRRTLDLLRRYESRNVTYIAPDGSWPIVWERARGCHVWDAEGRRYLDLTAAFGVAAAGHANPAVVRAGQRQMERLLHAMGDVHPHALKAGLARELSRVTFERWSARGAGMSGGEDLGGRRSGVRKPGVRRFPASDPDPVRPSRLFGRTIFCNSGFEAVEAALKTARLATGRSGVIAFEGAYHGLGYGALSVTHREHFRGAFRNQLREFGRFVPYPSDAASLEGGVRRLRGLLERGSIGAILVEPVQARGGIRIPPSGFLPLLRGLCDEHGALLILDEIYTGFGRTGRWFGCEHSGVIPDVICLGKALTGGFPMSACVGRSGVMDAWPESRGEAIHTSTYLGHPVGCAMALAQMSEIRRLDLPRRSARLGELLRRRLGEIEGGGFRISIRGIGLMAGLELEDGAGRPATASMLRLIQRLLWRRCVFLPEGEHASVLAWTPPLTISEAQLMSSVAVVAEELGRLA